MGALKDDVRKNIALVNERINAKEAVIKSPATNVQQRVQSQKEKQELIATRNELQLQLETLNDEIDVR